MPASRRRSAVLAAAVLAVAGCAAPAASTDHDAAPEPAPAPAATPVHHEQRSAEVALCTVLPAQIVGELVRAGSVESSGDGSHCTWHLQVPSPVGAGGHAADLADHGGGTLQGAFVDLGAFHAGRPPAHEANVAELAGVGDEAFVVHLGDAAPSTLYVRDGGRALSLWVDDVPMSPEATERSLARMASLLLDLA